MGDECFHIDAERIALGNDDQLPVTIEAVVTDGLNLRVVVLVIGAEPLESGRGDGTGGHERDGSLVVWWVMRLPAVLTEPMHGENDWRGLVAGVVLSGLVLGVVELLRLT
jgi:hypothetical protein